MISISKARSLRVKSRSAVLLLLAGLSAPAAAQQGQSFAEQRAEWNKPLEPFRIAGNVYYVGTAGLSAFLITGPEGHVLIDGAMEESAEQIAGNIRKLGFRVEDVRYLLNNHAHWDHSGGLAALKKISGAKLVASRLDKPALESGRPSYRADVPPTPPVKVDKVVRDGSRLRLGSVVLTAHLTPGHTRGCTSWSLRTAEKGWPYDVLFACSLTVAGQSLVGDRLYPDAATDFRNTFAKLKAMKADIFLTFHPSFFNLEEKRRRLAAGDVTGFIDPTELERRVTSAEAAFELELARQKAIVRSGADEVKE